MLASLGRKFNAKRKNWVLCVDNSDGLEEEICITLTYGAEQVGTKGLVLVTSQNLRCTLWKELRIFVKEPLGRKSAVHTAWDMRLWSAQPVTRVPVDGAGLMRVANYIPRAILDINATHGVRGVGGLPGGKSPLWRGTLNIEAATQKHDLECVAIPHYKGGHPKIWRTENWPRKLPCLRAHLRSVDKIKVELVQLRNDAKGWFVRFTRVDSDDNEFDSIILQRLGLDLLRLGCVYEVDLGSEKTLYIAGAQKSRQGGYIMLGLLKERSSPGPESSPNSVRGVGKIAEVANADGVKVKSRPYADLIFEVPMLSRSIALREPVWTGTLSVWGTCYLCKAVPFSLRTFVSGKGWTENMQCTWGNAIPFNSVFTPSNRVLEPERIVLVVPASKDQGEIDTVPFSQLVVDLATHRLLFEIAQPNGTLHVFATRLMRQELSLIGQFKPCHPSRSVSR